MRLIPENEKAMCIYKRRPRYIKHLPNYAGCIACRCTPLVACRNIPVSVTGPSPIRIGDDLLLGRDEGLHWAHTICIRFTTLNPSKRCNSIIDYDAYLVITPRITGQHCQTELKRLLFVSGPEDELTLDLHIGGEGS